MLKVGDKFYMSESPNVIFTINNIDVVSNGVTIKMENLIDVSWSRTEVYHLQDVVRDLTSLQYHVNYRPFDNIKINNPLKKIKL